MDNELNKEARLELIGMMAKFFRFLLSLDIYIRLTRFVPRLLMQWV